MDRTNKGIKNSIVAYNKLIIKPLIEQINRSKGPCHFYKNRTAQSFIQRTDKPLFLSQI